MDPARFTLSTLALAGLAGLLVACGGGDSPTAPVTGPVASEDERGSVGVPPSAGEYCVKLGFTIAGDRCTFGDGTSCEQWAFYRGECGQPHSYCNQHGGAVSSKTENMGTWTAVYGVCDVNGKQCKESSFIQTGTCE
jgi:putative hemolysin